MRRLEIPIISLLILVLALGAIACGGNGGAVGSDPESTVRSVIKSMETRDVRTITSYCAEKPSDAEIQIMQLSLDTVDSLRAYNITTNLISQSGDEATVSFECDYEATVLGETESGHKSNTRDLVKIGDNWYITDCYLSL
ncbi:MAG: hypothetical protein JSW38_00820 [Dehalococcoidia bacterium]|nr:MAG: hypothetical protein JSW38_00820 [Dehalococcoidia bacterium]